MTETSLLKRAADQSHDHQDSSRLKLLINEIEFYPKTSAINKLEL